MQKYSFLTKLKKERRLEKVDPSKEISLSYLQKSENCLKAAKILYDAKLYENSVSEAYYAMYNILLSMFFHCGIKCENHTAGGQLLVILFQLENLEKMFVQAKKERIDKQYYVSGGENEDVTNESAKQMIVDAEEFTLTLRGHLLKFGTSDIEKVREKFEKI